MPTTSLCHEPRALNALRQNGMILLEKVENVHEHITSGELTGVDALIALQASISEIALYQEREGAQEFRQMNSLLCEATWEFDKLMRRLESSWGGSVTREDYKSRINFVGAFSWFTSKIIFLTIMLIAIH